MIFLDGTSAIKGMRVPVVLERDQNIPNLDELLNELGRIRVVVTGAAPAAPAALEAPPALVPAPAGAVTDAASH